MNAQQMQVMNAQQMQLMNIPPPPSMQAISVPSAPIGCPTGLEYILGSTGLLIRQQVELLEMMGMGIETPNKYDIFDPNGQRLYYAAEVGDFLAMQLSLSAGRSFTIQVFDCIGRPILTIQRPYNAAYDLSKAFNFAGNSGTMIMAYLADSSYLGMIQQQPNGIDPLLFGFDNKGNKIIEIVGPPGSDCCCACPGAFGAPCYFIVKTIDGQEIGHISKEWGGYLKESYTDADNFSVMFPQTLGVRTKALLLAATFLIDFMFFESKARSRHHRRHSF